MRRTLALTLLALMVVAANAFAVGEGRIQGKVIDAVTKKPIPGAAVKFESTGGRNVKQEYKADKNGEYRFLVLDATLTYNFTWSADGYQPTQEKIKLKIGEVTTRDVALTPLSAVQAAAPAQQQAKADPAVTAYNDGAGLANDGKNAEAIAKMEEAVSLKPEFAAAYQALARLYARTKNHAKAIDAANKALAISGDDPDMFAILADEHSASGQKEKAAEYRKKAPADANSLFNEAARMINEGKDNQAEPLLKQAIVANDKMAPAYYELGMLYVRTSKNADARTNLEKYLELDPNGKEAGTAKEMLKYVK
ncbi:MAG: carboxypeptidase regulatory-like domain-containing protein [Acidobacteriota bacterium]